jgi:hypothetical protein
VTLTVNLSVSIDESDPAAPDIEREVVDGLRDVVASLQGAGHAAAGSITGQHVGHVPLGDAATATDTAVDPSEARRAAAPEGEQAGPPLRAAEAPETPAEPTDGSEAAATPETPAGA